MKSLILKSLLIFFSILFSAGQGFSQQISDRDLKINVNPLSGSLRYIERLEPVKFQYNTTKFKKLNLPSGVYMGFIGEDVNQILPSLVAYEARYYMQGKNESKTAQLKSLNLEHYIPLLVGAIQEQQQQIELLRQELMQLKANKGSK